MGKYYSCWILSALDIYIVVISASVMKITQAIVTEFLQYKKERGECNFRIAGKVCQPFCERQNRRVDKPGYHIAIFTCENNNSVFPSHGKDL